MLCTIWQFNFAGFWNLCHVMMSGIHWRLTELLQKIVQTVHRGWHVSISNTFDILTTDLWPKLNFWGVFFMPPKWYNMAFILVKKRPGMEQVLYDFITVRLWWNTYKDPTLDHNLILDWVSEWVSGCCLREKYVRYIKPKTWYISLR